MGFLNDHVIAITGGCGDIGRATAARLSAEGAKVVLMDVIGDQQGETVAQVFGPGAMYFRADVTERAAVEKALNGAVSRHGRLDAVISNAGMVMNQPFLDIELDKWSKTLAVNLTGCFQRGSDCCENHGQTRATTGRHSRKDSLYRELGAGYAFPGRYFLHRQQSRGQGAGAEHGAGTCR